MIEYVLSTDGPGSLVRTAAGLGDFKQIGRHMDHDVIPLCAYHHREAFAWAGRIERLRRQHKEKARGRNWRNVR